MKKSKSFSLLRQGLSLGLLLLSAIFIGCGGENDEPQPIQITFEDSSFTIEENPESGTVIGMLSSSATRGDESIDITYSITTQSVEDAVEVNSVTGELKVLTASVFDADINAKITLTVQAAAEDQTTTAQVTINVSATEIILTANDMAFEILENADIDDEVGTISASAELDGEVQPVTFTISNQSVEGAVALGETTGILTVADAAAFDYEKNKTITVEVTVASGDQSKIIMVTINLENEKDGFITTWKTTTSNESITIATWASSTDRLESSYVYDYTIYWGDGTVESGQTDDVTHTYASPGTYEVEIEGKFPGLRTGGAENAAKLMTVEQWGNIDWEIMQYAFSSCVNMTYNATDVPNLENVTNMGAMFFRAEKFNGDISSWDVSNISYLSGMFQEASSFNQDIGNWNVSNVQNTSYMFNGATSFNQDIGSWNVSNVEYMTEMFLNASSFNQDISSWNVSNVRFMSYMFHGASSFNQDISGWNVSSVQQMDDMFEFATNFDQNLGSWDISAIGSFSNSSTTMERMFRESGMSIRNYDLTLNGWANLSTVPSNITLGAHNLEYCSFGEAARNTLINDKGWTINADSKASASDCAAIYE